jgi:hypothetical protein
VVGEEVGGDVDRLTELARAALPGAEEGDDAEAGRIGKRTELRERPLENRSGGWKYIN